MKRDRVVRRGIELILLNVTLRAIAPPTPFVPAGNKRRFHPRDVVKLLSLPRVFPTSLLPSFLPSSRLLGYSSVYTGFAKMIYGRLGSLHHSSSSSRVRHVHGCIHTYIRIYTATEDRDLNGLQRVIREFIGAYYTYYSSARGENCRSRETSFIISKKKSRCIGQPPPPSFCPRFTGFPPWLINVIPSLRIDAVFHVSRPRLAENFPILLCYIYKSASLSVIVLSDFSRGTSSLQSSSRANRKSERIVTSRMKLTGSFRALNNA